MFVISKERMSEDVPTGRKDILGNTLLASVVVSIGVGFMIVSKLTTEINDEAGFIAGGGIMFAGIIGLINEFRELTRRS